MIRKIASFKYAIFGLFSAALVSVACSDDEDAIFNGGAGSAGKNSGGAGSGGKASTAGSSSSGAPNGGSTASAGTAGTTSTAGTGGTAGNAGTATMGGAGADAGGAGGASGEGGMPMGGEGGALSGGAGGAGGEGGTPFVPDVLDNPGFEANLGTTITGWTNEGTPDASFVEYKDVDAHSGHNKLSHWTAWTQGGANPPYTARTYQTVGPIANGTYSFSMWVNRDWETEQYLYARGFNANDPSEEKRLDTTDEAGYTKYTLSGIQVTSGTCTVGIYTSAPAGSFANIDDAELVLE